MVLGGGGGGRGSSGGGVDLQFGSRDPAGHWPGWIPTGVGALGAHSLPEAWLQQKGPTTLMTFRPGEMVVTRMSGVLMTHLTHGQIYLLLANSYLTDGQNEVVRLND